MHRDVFTTLSGSATYFELPRCYSRKPRMLSRTLGRAAVRGRLLLGALSEDHGLPSPSSSARYTIFAATTLTLPAFGAASCRATCSDVYTMSSASPLGLTEL